MLRLEDSAFSVRVAAAEAVKWLLRGGAVDPEAIATLYAVATSSNFADTRAIGCAGLGALGDLAEPHIAVIARRLEDDGIDVRTSAAAALDRLRQEGAVDAKVLASAYASAAGSPFPSARAMGCDGLGSLGNAVKPYALLLAWKLSDGSTDVRAAARAAVHRLRQDEVDVELVAKIYAAAASGDLSEARVVGCRGLGALGIAAVPHVPLLHDIALTDRSSDVQNAAKAAADEVANAFLLDTRMSEATSSLPRRKELPANAEYLLVSCPEVDERGEPVSQFAAEVMKAYGGTSATGGVYRAIQALQAQDPSKVLILVTIDGESGDKFDPAQFEREMPSLAANTRAYHCADVQALVGYFESGGPIPNAQH